MPDSASSALVRLIVMVASMAVVALLARRTGAPPSGPVQAPRSLEAALEPPPDPQASIGFGFKIGWIAVRGTSPDKVTEELALGGPRACDWEMGLRHATRST